MWITSTTGYVNTEQVKMFIVENIGKYGWTVSAVFGDSLRARMFPDDMPTPQIASAYLAELMERINGSLCENYNVKEELT